MEEGKLGEAEKPFGKSVLVDPESRLAWSKLAEIHNSKQNLAQEIQSLRKVVALEPENVEALAAFVRSPGSWRIVQKGSPFDDPIETAFFALVDPVCFCPFLY